MIGERHTRGHLLVGAVIVAAGCVYAWWMLFVLSREAVVAIPSDDAFYYFKIARNLIAGKGCTFDGIVPTNGFHPLWMVVVLPVYLIFPSDLETPVRLILAGTGLLGSATLLILYGVVRRYVAVGVGAGAGLVAIAACTWPPVGSAMTNGLETGLLLFVVTLLLWVCYRWDLHASSASSTRTLLLGMCLGLVTLCRLDTVFIMTSAVFLTLAFYVLGELTMRRCVERLVILGIGFGLVFGPYLLWNATQFGQIMPISGAMKSSFPSLRQPLSLGGDTVFGAALLILVWVFLILGVLGDPDSATRVRRAIHSPLTLLAVACAFHFVHAFLFLTWGVYWWHFSIYGLTLALTLAQAVDRWTMRWVGVRRTVLGAVVLILLVPAVGLRVYEFRAKGAQHRAWLEGADWARNNTPAETVFAIKDAGLFGYFSDRSAVNLDGKANGRQYRDALYEDDVDGYLRRVQVEYIADISGRYSEGVCRIGIPRVNRKAVILRLEQSREVFGSRPFGVYRHRFRAAGEARFVIWKYAEQGVAHP